MSDPTQNPSARARRLARIRGDIPKTYPHKTFRAGAVVADGFTSTKSEKRMIRHSVFMDKVESSSQATKQPSTKQSTTPTPAPPTPAPAPTSSKAPSALANPLRASKRTKPQTKSSILRASSSRITKPSASAKSSKIRRPNKKLVTTLNALADALPSLETEDGQAAAGGGMVLEGTERGKVRHTTLPSKAGALKKKEMIVRGEMERFGLSLAKLVGPKDTGRRMNSMSQSTAAGDGMDVDAGESRKTDGGTSDRWKALRGYITSTMERNPAFVS